MLHARDPGSAVLPAPAIEDLSQLRVVQAPENVPAQYAMSHGNIQMEILEHLQIISREQKLSDINNPLCTNCQLETAGTQRYMVSMLNRMHDPY